MSQRLVVDVRLTWCGDAIAVRRFSGGQIAKLGDGPGCLAPVPVASEGDWPVARVDGSSARVVVPPKAAAVVERGAGATQRFGALAAVTLAVGDRARVIFGDFEVDVAPAWEEIAPPKGKRAFAFAPLLHLAVAAAAHAVVIVGGARSAAADDDVHQADAAYDMQRFLARADDQARAADDGTSDEYGRGDTARGRPAHDATTGSDVAQRAPSRHGVEAPVHTTHAGPRGPRAGAPRSRQDAPRAPALGRSIEPRSPTSSPSHADPAEGRLPPEVVQRIVRANFGRFRVCYENGLAQNPTLEGRIVTQFVVDAHGAVIASSDAGSAFADRDVVACVVHAFRGISFPREADAARVTVTYPLLLSPR